MRVVDYFAGVALGRGVPVFVKQDSAPRAGSQGRIPDYVWTLKQRPPLHVPACDASLPLLAHAKGGAP